MKKIFSVSFSLFCLCADAQVTFQKAYGGAEDYDEGNSVQQTNDGGYIIVGGTRSFGAGSDDVYLIKTNSVGDTLWTRTFGGANEDIGNSVRQTTDGGYIITGETNSFGLGQQDVYLIKTDVNGNIIWSKTIGGPSYEVGNDVKQTTDGGYIIAGMRFGTSSVQDAYLIKTNAIGDTLWTRSFDGGNSEYAYAVQQISDGGYILAGQTNSNSNIFLARTDGSGNVVWAKSIDNTAAELANDVEQTTDGGFIMVGQTDYFGFGYRDIYLVKTDSSGDVVWAKTFGGGVYSDSDVGNAVRQTADGGYIVSGQSTANTTTGWDACLIKTDNSGDMLWTKSYGGIGTDRGFDIQLTTDGGFVVAGHTSSFGAGLRDVFLLKTDSSGNSICIEPTTAIVTLFNTHQITVLTLTPSITFGGIVTNLSTQYGSGATVSNSCDITAIEEGIKNENFISLFPTPPPLK